MSKLRFLAAVLVLKYFIEMEGRFHGKVANTVVSHCSDPLKIRYAVSL